MSDLISRSNLIMRLCDYALQESPNDNESEGEQRISKMIYEVIQNCIACVEEQPTVYDVDKVVEELKELKMRYFLTIANTGDEKSDFAYENVGNALDGAIEIVKQESEQFGTDTNVGSNGWILCDKEMPKENESIFAKFKGTDKWSNGMFEKTSDEVIVTVIDKYGNTKTVHAHTLDGKWSCDLLNIKKSCQVIAWQPLPQPYQPKESEKHEIL